MNFKLSIYTFFIIFVFFINTLYSQSTTNSPYSGFGVGDLSQLPLSRNFGMGGVGVGMSDRYAINRINPASYSELWRFTFDITGFYQSTNFQTTKSSNTLETGGFQGFAMVFKKRKPLAFAIGLNPYSTVGYAFVQTRLLPSVNQKDTFAYTSQRSGEGGLNDAFVGVSTQFWKRKIGVGANFRYIFGKVQSTWITNATLTAAPPEIETRNNMKGFGLQLGAIYGDTLKFIDSSLVVRVGLTADLVPSLKLNNTTTIISPGYDPLGTTVYYAATVSQDQASTISLPNQYGLGISIGKAGKYIIAADFIYQDWSKFKAFQNQQLGTNIKTVLGFEYIPNIFAYKRFFSRMAYRGGLTYVKNLFQRK